MMRRRHCACLVLALLVAGNCVGGDTMLVAAPNDQGAKMRPAEVRRWFDNSLRRTSVAAFFDQPSQPPCVVVGGIFIFRDAGIELMYATPYPHSFGSEKVSGGRLLTLRDRRCRTRLHVSKEV